MNQLFRYFLTFVATIAILMPSLGFMVVKHTCSTCNTVEVNLIGLGSCSGCEVSKAIENESNCCSAENSSGSCGIEGGQDFCCTFEITQAEVDDYVMPTSTSEKVQFLPVESLLVLPATNDDDHNSTHFLNYQDPPLTFLTGIEFLFFINQLKIPTC